MVKIVFWKIIDMVFSIPVLLVSILSFCTYQTSGVDFFLLDFFTAMLLTLVIVLITNRINFSLAVTLFIGLFLVTLHDSKMRFWGAGLEACDFQFIPPLIKHSQGIFTEYKDNLLVYAAQILLFALVSGLLFIRSKKLVRFNSKLTFWLVRVSLVLLAGLLCYALKYSLSDSSSRLNQYLNTKYQNRLENIKRKSTTYGYDGLNQDMGAYASMLFGFRFLDDECEKISDNITSEFVISSAKKYFSSKHSKAVAKLPNIIYILHESTFNPSDLGHSKLSGNKFSLFTKDATTAAIGKAKVRIFGGNSQNTEFSTLTGLDTNMFKWRGLAPNLFLASNTKSSLATELKKAGYKTILLYPVPKDFANAANAASNLKIDVIYDIKDFPEFLSKEELQSSWPVVSDFAIYNMIEKILDNESEAEENAPIAIFVSTMSNHGKHANNYQDKHDLAKDYGHLIASKLNDYLDRLQQSDEASKKLWQALLARKKPVMLVQYGDHKPSFEGEMQNLLQMSLHGYEQKYTTFFHIKTNFHGSRINHYELLDLHFLPGIILDIIGINSSDFFLSNSYMRDICHGNLDRCQNHHSKYFHPDLIPSYKKLSLEQVFLPELNNSEPQIQLNSTDQQPEKYSASPDTHTSNQ